MDKGNKTHKTLCSWLSKMNHFPDKWMILKIFNGDETHYKVFGSWTGGYINGDSWRLNSGITKILINGDTINFHGHSGSVYSCHKNSYGSSIWTNNELQKMLKRLTVNHPDAVIKLMDEKKAMDYIDATAEIVENDIVFRLRKRAEIRRNIPGRKSVQENNPDRIADLLDEAADEIEKLNESQT